MMDSRQILAVYADLVFAAATAKGLPSPADLSPEQQERLHFWLVNRMVDALTDPALFDLDRMADELIQEYARQCLEPWRERLAAGGRVPTPQDGPETAPAGSDGAEPASAADNDRAEWTRIVRQAEASGNITLYLERRKIPKSTYYVKKNLYRL